MIFYAARILSSAEEEWPSLAVLGRVRCYICFLDEAPLGKLQYALLDLLSSCQLKCDLLQSVEVYPLFTVDSPMISAASGV